MKHLILGCLLALPGYASADKAPRGPDFDAHRPHTGVDRSLAASSGTHPIQPTDDVLFANHSTQLDSTALVALRNASRWLHRHPGFRIVLEGHASSPGSDAYNEHLAMMRVNNVREHLIDAGIEPDRIVMVIFGEEGAQPDGNPNDRRVVMYASLEGPRQIVDATLGKENALSAMWTWNGSLLTARSNAISRR